MEEDHNEITEEESFIQSALSQLDLRCVVNAHFVSVLPDFCFYSQSLQAQFRDGHAST